MRTFGVTVVYLFGLVGLAWLGIGAVAAGPGQWLMIAGLFLMTTAWSGRYGVIAGHWTALVAPPAVAARAMGVRQPLPGWCSSPPSRCSSRLSRLG
jgi:hypothetical protein